MTTVLEYGQASPDLPHLLTYQKNSYQDTLTSKVLSCQPWSLPDPSRKKNTGKNKNKNKNKEPEYYEVLLSDTVLFAEGGGQPTDYGTINDDINVSFVARTDKGTVLHKTDKALTVGNNVNIKLNWERRFDHMQQHSSQHLISAVFRNELNAPTISWWMSQYPQSSNIELGNIDNITNEELKNIEMKINNIIRDAKPMPVHIFYDEKTIEEFAQEHDSFKQKKELPAGAGALRVIEIPNVEYNTCCGTHVGNTSQLQVVKLLNVTKTKTSLMVEFIAGNRVIDTMSRMVENERNLNNLLSCGPDEHFSNVTKLQTELKSRNSDLRAMEKRLIDLEVSRLLNKIINENESIIYEHFERGNISTFSSIIDGILSNPLFAVKSNDNNNNNNNKGGKKDKKNKKDKKDKKETKNEKSEKTTQDNDKTKNNNIIAIIFSIGQSKNAGMYYLGSNDVNLINKQNKNDLLSTIDAKGGGKPGRLQGNANNLKDMPKFLDNLKIIIGDRAFVNKNEKNNNNNNNNMEKSVNDNVDLISDVAYIAQSSINQQAKPAFVKQPKWESVDTF